MRYSWLCWFAVALMPMTSGGAQAAEIQVVANSAVTVSRISAEDLKEIFLGTRTTLADGTHVQPVLLKGGAAHETFLREYLGKTGIALLTYYRGLVFTGKGSMPKTFPAEADVIAYVARTKGAIGYVSAGAAAAGVRTLSVK